MSATISEQAEIRSMAHELARRELSLRTAAIDSGDQDAWAECWQLLTETGLDRALLDERHGGVGLGVAELLTVVEELAIGDGGIAMSVLLCNAALATLSDEQLAGLGEGARWALVPATSGTELAISNGQLDGNIACALGCHGVDGVVLLALDRSSPATWALHANTAGLKFKRDLAQLGLRGAAAASLELQDVSAPSTDCDTVIDGASASALLYAGTAAIARGIARRAHEMAFEYAQARQQGGVAIIEHDAVSDMLTAMAVRLTCRPEMLIEASGKLRLAQSLAAKIAATDAAVATTTDAVQVFGGTGYMVETGIEKLMRDAKYCQLFPQANWLLYRELTKA
ncbi:MAG TPA: acyl-CoA dehydrogenase family protein [Solirubrobacteraceae bacterium]|jgi:hypothetical protein